jgi:hypothetical protein
MLKRARPARSAFWGTGNLDTGKGPLPDPVPRA